MRRLIQQIGPCTLQPRGEPFAVLVRAIVSQLISTKAARSVFERVEALCPVRALNPAAILQAGPDALRACGLSQTKTNTIHTLAQASTDGRLDLASLSLAEEEVINRALLEFKGIGPWTVHMFLIFGLCRLNVLPLGDLGVRAAVRDLYRLKELPAAEVMRKRARRWHPYCSVAAWYLWRSRDWVPESETTN